MISHYTYTALALAHKQSQMEAARQAGLVHITFATQSPARK